MGVKISVVISTAREESESYFPKWKEIVDDILHDRKSEYQPMGLIRGTFKKLLINTVEEDMESFLEPTLKSLAMQRFKDFEVIIVDRHVKRRKRITEIYESFLNIAHIHDKPSPWHDMKPPKGWKNEVDPPFPAVCNARNTGVIVANGELLVFLDDNIILSPKTLETCWKWYQKGYGVKLIRNRFNIDDKKIRFEPEFRNEEFSKLWRDGWQIYSYRGAWSHGFSVPLSWIIDVNGFEEVLLDGSVGAEDIDLGARISNYVEKTENRLRMIIDTDAVAWELGHLHIHHRRPPVRHNILLLDIVRNWKRDYLANTRKPTEEELEAYREEYIRRNGEETLHPFWNVFPVEPFNLKEQREAYQGGEFTW